MHKRAGAFEAISAAEVANRVYQLAEAFEAEGINKGDRIALLADNGPEWPVIDFATLCVGAVLAPVYPTLTAEQAAFIIADSGARIACIEGAERMEGLLRLRDQMPAVERFVLTGDDASPSDDVSTLSDWLEGHPRPDVEAFRERARSIEPTDLATFIYTSGTTGRPKGSDAVPWQHRFERRPPPWKSSTSRANTPLSASCRCATPSSARWITCYFARGVTIAYAESVQTVAQNFG